ncbi:MAG: baseplate J/gp47 family protein [Bacteroidales bacterium]|nr:baseplate J/gp47 family protein [Clostridium sp.]MCM1203313.1 baseplate J/gp47 family protein [Bacteroidales bacterium]
MLPWEEQENQSFEEIAGRAREKISRRYPAWTNYNPADSGMALLELFAYMTELQQFHLEQLGRSHRLAFLHLLGMSPAGMEPAAVVAVAAGVGRPFTLRKGTKAAAGKIIFEAAESVYLEKDNLIIPDAELPFYPFGENPESGAAYEIRLRDRLEKKTVHTLYFRLEDNYSVKRNAADSEEFIPLVHLQLEYSDGNGYRNGKIIKDTTFGLLQSGMLQFCIGERMERTGEAYKLRITVWGEYDTAPLIGGIGFNRIPFVQRDTVRECREFRITLGEKEFYEIVCDSWNAVHGDTRVFLRTEEGYKQTAKFAVYDEGNRHFVFAKEVFAEMSGEACVCLVSDCPERDTGAFTLRADGMPGQQFFLPDKNVLGKEFAVWTADDETPGRYMPWFPVKDFAQAGCMDRCYVLEEEKGILKFGDGRQGVIPRGDIEIIAYAVCQGTGGNIQRNQMTGFLQETGVKSLNNPFPAAGGRYGETVEDCVERYRREMQEKHRAVTHEDYVEIIKRTPGLRIKRARVCSSKVEENSLEAVVQPLTNNRRVLRGSGYEKNVMRFLEKRKMLGTRIIMKKPEYIRIDMRLEIMVKSRYPDGKEKIEERVRSYFDEKTDFGKTIVYGHLFGYIDSLPETEGIRELTLQAKGRGAFRDDNHDIHLPFYGMAYLEELKIRCIPAAEG